MTPHTVAELVSLARQNGVATMTYEFPDGGKVSFALFPPTPTPQVQGLGKDDFQDHEWAHVGVRPPNLRSERENRTALGPPLE